MSTVYHGVRDWGLEVGSLNTQRYEPGGIKGNKTGRPSPKEKTPKDEGERTRNQKTGSTDRFALTFFSFFVIILPFPLRILTSRLNPKPLWFH